MTDRVLAICMKVPISQVGRPTDNDRNSPYCRRWQREAQWPQGVEPRPPGLPGEVRLLVAMAIAFGGYVQPAWQQVFNCCRRRGQPIGGLRVTGTRGARHSLHTPRARHQHRAPRRRDRQRLHAPRLDVVHRRRQVADDIATWPAMTSASAVVARLYGTWTTSTPAMPLNSSADRCAGTAPVRCVRGVA